MSATFHIERLNVATGNYEPWRAIPARCIREARIFAQSETGDSADNLRISAISVSPMSVRDFEARMLVMDAQEHQRQPLSTAFQLVRLGYFTDLEQAVKAVAQHYKQP